MGGWALLTVAAILAGAALDARAGTVRMPCGSDVIATGKVARIEDGRSFILADGRAVRLAALEVPAEAGAAGRAARMALESLIAGRTVQVRSAGPTPDRYGRTIAHVYPLGTGPREGGGTEPSVARAMIAQGQARVGAEVGDSACAADLLSQERVARAAKQGLWADPQYAILDAGSLPELMSRQGRFALVEGRVVSVRASGGTVYVNFGRRWSQALTVTISKRRESIFAGAGVAPKGLADRRIRVRGWIEVRNGPRIDATHPEQIEMTGLN